MLWEDIFNGLRFSLLFIKHGYSLSILQKFTIDPMIYGMNVRLVKQRFQMAHLFNRCFKLLRDRSFITSQGGAVVLEGGYNFKTSAFLGGKFFSGRKHEGGQIL